MESAISNDYREYRGFFHRVTTGHGPDHLCDSKLFSENERPFLVDHAPTASPPSAWSPPPGPRLGMRPCLVKTRDIPRNRQISRILSTITPPRRRFLLRIFIMESVCCTQKCSLFPFGTRLAL
jgi:hypothetical protein